MREVEAELDDAVEQSYPYQFLTDVRAASGLWVGMMSAGAEQSPSRPSRDETLDPARILDPSDEQLRRRLEQVSPAAGRHFVGMCQAVAEQEHRLTSVAEAFHNAREMLSALSQVLMTVSLLRVEQQHGTSAAADIQLDSGQNIRTLIVEQLGLSAHTEHTWARLQPHRHAHRQGLGQPRAMSEILVKETRNAASIAEELVSAYERNIDVVLTELHRLRTAPADAATIERLSHFVPPNHEAARDLLDELEDPEWWPHLRKRKFFDDVPGPVSHAVHPRWAQTRYLARIAATVKAPGDFADLLIQIGHRTSNVRVHEDLLRAAAKLPPPHASRVLQAELSWPLTEMHLRVARLAGEPEIIRYPAWRAGLLAHVAFHADATTQAALDAHDALRSLLRVEDLSDETERADYDTAEMDGAALADVLLHLRVHADLPTRMQLCALLTRNVTEISEHIATSTVDEPLEDLIPTMTGTSIDTVFRWYVDEDDLTDRSQLVLSEWPNSSGETPLEGLLTGLAGVLVDLDAAGIDVTQMLSSAPDRARIGLMDRVLLTAVAWAESPSPTLVHAALEDPRRGQVFTTRLPYVAALSRHWSTLPAALTSRIRATLLQHDDPVHAFIASAALVGVGLPDLDEESYLRQATELFPRPRTMMALVRGTLDLFADEHAPQVPSAHREEPPADPPVGSRAHAEELLGRSDPLSEEDWRLLLRVLSSSPRSPRRDLLANRRTLTAWLHLAQQQLRAGHWPPTRLVRPLMRRMLREEFSWTSAVDTSTRPTIGHDAVSATQFYPQAQAFLLRLEIAGKAAPISDRHRDRFLTILRKELRSRSPQRSMFLTLVGFMLPTVHDAQSALWRGLFRPWLDEVMNAASGDGSTRAEAVREIAAVYSGLTVRTHPIRPAFVTETRDLYQWVITHLKELELPGNISPSPVVTHAFLTLLGEAADDLLPGPATVLLLQHAPPLLQLGTLRRFGALGELPEGIARQVRSLWDAVLAHVHAHPEHPEVLASISTWAANPVFSRSLGASWVLTHLEKVVHEHAVVDDCSTLLRALAEFVENDQTLVDQVAALALTLRRRGLVDTTDGRAATMLVHTLEQASNASSHLSELRAELTADRVIRPLSTVAGHTAPDPDTRHET